MKLLLLRFGSLGDLLLVTPLLRALASQHPAWELHLALKRRYEGLFAECPYLNTVWVLNRDRGASGLFRLTQRLREEQFTAVIDLHRSLRSALLRLWLGRPRDRFPKGRLRRALLVHAGLRLGSGWGSVAERYFAPFHRWGVQPDGRGLEIPIPHTVQAALDRRLAAFQTESWLALAPGSRWAAKRWPQDRFVEAGRTLMARHGLGALILGDEGEAELGHQVAQALGPRAENLAGQLTLVEAAAVLRRARLLLANDSGLTHLATAARTPVVALFGPTTADLGFFPYRSHARVVERDLPCRPCTKQGRDGCPLGHHHCLTGIPVEAVVEAAEELLALERVEPPSPVAGTHPRIIYI